MRSIIRFPSKWSFADGALHDRDSGDMLRSMTVVTQQLELMLDILRERARQEAEAAQAAPSPDDPRA